MNPLGSAPASRRLFAPSVVTGLPLGMLGIGLIVDTQRLTGSLAGAGLATYASGGALCRSGS
jgi:hypothetical protein